MSAFIATWINQHLLLFACVILAGVLVFRWLLLNLIATASGWKMLAARFPTQQPFSGPEWKWQSARMRYSMGYNNCLRVGADAMGMLIQPMWGLRTAHPPLFVPWHEIRVEPASGWMKEVLVQLRLGRSEQIPFTIRDTLSSKLQAAAGANWPAS